MSHREEPWWIERWWSSFSFVGLALATLFFAASLTPSLLPRHFAVQGVLSGLALATGYGVGVLGVWLWRFLEIPDPPSSLQRFSKVVTSIAVLLVAIVFLRYDALWQNSIRERMAMEPIETGYPLWVAIISLAAGVGLRAFVHGGCGLWRWVNRNVHRVVPRRVAYMVSSLLVGSLLLLIINDVLAKVALDVADSFFLTLDTAIDDDLQRPSGAWASGGPGSLIDWDALGRQGRRFVAQGPTKDAISEFWNQETKQPLRIYVGMGAAETLEERAKLALKELQRVGGFDRSLLVVATPTGTGWLDPGAADSLEYLHAGDTAMVSMQYSYLPSWITILVDPPRSREAAHFLFTEVYQYWRTLPKDRRPKLYVHGLSLGALGSEGSADLFTIFDDPIQGGMWSGPPFPSPGWRKITRGRNPGSPMWLPRFRDGSMVRFTGQKNALDQDHAPWGPMRFVYLQYASDPMVFFSPELLYERPDWLNDPRGPDVSPYLRWFPIVTFLQVGFDIPMATSVPLGYGHNYAPENYIDAWIAVTAPPDWKPGQSRRLGELLRKRGTAGPL